MGEAAVALVIRRFARLLCLLGGLLLWGCVPASGEAFLDAFYAAKRAYQAGRYEEAASHYRRAAEVARRVKDRDEALFLEARMRERQKRPLEAQQIYQELVDVSPEGPRTARAVFEIAEIEIAHGESERGWAMLRAAVVRYPDHGSARRGLTRWVERVAERDGEEQARAMIQQDLPRFSGTEAEQQAKYEHALSLERSGLLEQARDALVQLAREHPYPLGNLTDDALWRASLLDEKLGRPERAVEDLREMLATHEDTAGGQRYERPRFPDAQMRIAELYRDELGDPRAARQEFRKVYRNHPESILGDDAMWEEAALAHRAGEAAEACELCAELREDYPDSRYLRCVDLLCPSARPAANARPCPRYIVEALAEGRSVHGQD